MGITKAQQWARNLSKNLENSYDSSALIEHKVTSGNSRETQVLDILQIMLPQYFSLKKNVVIMDSTDTQTIKFDGAFVDIQNWQRLYAEEGMIVSPIESVKMVFEIKSDLGKSELDKIFEEAKNINSTIKIGAYENPKVIGFSYKCANPKLSYFDFVNNFLASSYNSPYAICILNVGMLCFIDKEEKIVSAINEQAKAVFISAKEDSLLLFMYFLTELLSHEQIATTMRQYSKHLYEDLKYFGFEDEFIGKMKSGNSDNLRDRFKGNLDKSIEEVYEKVKAL